MHGTNNRAGPVATEDLVIDCHAQGVGILMWEYSQDGASGGNLALLRVSKQTLQYYERVIVEDGEHANVSVF